MALYTKAMSLLSVKDKKTPSARLGRRAECESCILRHYPSAEGRVCSRGGIRIPMSSLQENEQLPTLIDVRLWPLYAKATIVKTKSRVRENESHINNYQILIN